MACFLAPVAEAAAVTIATKVMETKAKDTEGGELIPGADKTAVEKVPFTRKLKWLSRLLWGGSGLLAFEHLWHGEVVPFAPFLTAMESPAETAAMFHEIATTGVTMAVLVTAIWGGMVFVTSLWEKEENASAFKMGGVRK